MQDNLNNQPQTTWQAPVCTKLVTGTIICGTWSATTNAHLVKTRRRLGMCRHEFAVLLKISYKELVSIERGTKQLSPEECQALLDNLKL